MLADQLKDDDEAVDAYVAGLCAYMDSPGRVRFQSLPKFTRVFTCCPLLLQSNCSFCMP